MALQITESCVNCWACVDVCPNDAIFEDKPHFLIDDGKCTECLGDHGVPQCAAICPIEWRSSMNWVRSLIRLDH
jgi:ferredoxin